MYKLYLELNHKTDSNNVLLRKNKYALALANKDIYALISTRTKNKKPEIPLTNFKLILERHYWKALDYDNLVASFKPYVDGLTRSGIIKDDSFLFSGKWEVDQRFRPKKDGPLITIEVLESREFRTWKD